ncbi:hypothetical protein HYU10_00870 [Candidatus Woesearchaeota archaeon]|nr:hypothetical protein [Candidatus Woesearchaeota archaeon]
MSLAKWYKGGEELSPSVFAIAGDGVELRVTGTNCIRNTVSFDVREHDLTGQEGGRSDTPGNEMFDTETEAKANWIVPYPLETDVLDYDVPPDTTPNPEYKYTASIATPGVTGMPTVVSPFLNVRMPEDYETCESRGINGINGHICRDGDCSSDVLGASGMESGQVCCSIECGGSPIIQLVRPTESEFNPGEDVWIEASVNMDAEVFIYYKIGPDGVETQAGLPKDTMSNGYFRYTYLIQNVQAGTYYYKLYARKGSFDAWYPASGYNTFAASEIIRLNAKKVAVSDTEGFKLPRGAQEDDDNHDIYRDAYTNDNTPQVRITFNIDADITVARLEGILGTSGSYDTTTDLAALTPQGSHTYFIDFGEMPDGDYKLVLQANEEGDAGNALHEYDDNEFKIHIKGESLVLSEARIHNELLDLREDQSTELRADDLIYDHANDKYTGDIRLKFNREVDLSEVTLSGPIGAIDLKNSIDRIAGESSEAVKVYKTASEREFDDSPSDTPYNLRVVAVDWYGNSVTKDIVFSVNARDFSIFLLSPRYGFSTEHPFDVEIETDNSAACSYTVMPPNIRQGEFQSSAEPNERGGYLHTIDNLNLNTEISGKISGFTYRADEPYEISVVCTRGTVSHDKTFTIGVADVSNPFAIENIELNPPEIFEKTALIQSDVDIPSALEYDALATVTTTHPSVCRYEIRIRNSEAKACDSCDGMFDGFSTYYEEGEYQTYEVMEEIGTIQSKALVLPIDLDDGVYDLAIECFDKAARPASLTKRDGINLRTRADLQVTGDTSPEFDYNEPVELKVKTNKIRGVSCLYGRQMPGRGDLSLNDPVISGALDDIDQTAEDKLATGSWIHSQDIGTLPYGASGIEYDYRVNCVYGT